MYVWMVTCWVVGAFYLALSLLAAVAAVIDEWLFDRQVEKGVRRLAELEAKYVEEGYEPWEAAEKACREAWNSIDEHYQLLPVDADGEVIHVGDTAVMDWADDKARE